MSFIDFAFSLYDSDESADYIQIDAKTRIQVLDTMVDVAGADKEQQGAFIRDERVLVAWTDELDFIVPLCKEFEQKLIKLVWRSRPSMRGLKSSSTVPFSQAPSTVGSAIGLNEKIAEEPEPQSAFEDLPSQPVPPPKKTKGLFSFWKSTKAPAPTAVSDAEKGDEKEKRPLRLFSPIYSGFAAALSLCKCLLWCVSTRRSHVRGSLLWKRSLHAHRRGHARRDLPALRAVRHRPAFVLRQPRKRPSSFRRASR
jgi:hypothetical protein